MRKRIYEIIEVANENDRLSHFYDVIMILIIIISILPLTIKEPGDFEIRVDRFCVIIFFIDYILRLITADFKYPEKSKMSAYLRYPFSFMAIIDLLSIIPLMIYINEGFKMLILLRIIRGFRVFRIFKALRYSKTLNTIKKVLKGSKDSLFAVFTIAVGYILVSALLVFHAEPETFETFFDALYWATMSITTVGYGDIYPLTTIGRLITMLSSVLGIAIIALPSGIITAGFMKAIDDE